MIDTIPDTTETDSLRSTPAESWNRGITQSKNIAAPHEISLDTGRQLLEFAPLLVELLEQYPDVVIVLTRAWSRRLPEERVISYLPPELRPSVVGTTSNIKARRSYMLDGTERTHIITSYVYGSD